MPASQEVRLMSWANKFAKPFRVEHGKKFRLKDHDPADTAKLHSQERAGELLAKGIARVAELQDKILRAKSQCALDFTAECLH